MKNLCTDLSKIKNELALDIGDSKTKIITEVEKKIVNSQLTRRL